MRRFPLFPHVTALLAVAIAASACGPAGKPPAPPIAAAVSNPAEILAASNLPALVPSALAGDSLGVTVHRLSNGLTVYISPNPQAPRVSAWIAVRAGSRNDPPDSTGLAHYLEHMLFKGSNELGTLDAEAERPHIERIAQLYAELRQIPDTDQARRSELFAAIDAETQKSAAYAIPNEFDQLYARMGILGVNAFTGDDQTVYIGDVPTNRFAAWARVEAERMREPVFRLFYPELESVYEEKNRSLDNPLDRVFERLAATLFPAHPYGTQPTIGVTEHLKTPAYGDMVEFYERWYVPNNIAIVLAGDIDAQTALPVLEEHFGAWQPKPLPALAPARIEPLAGRTAHELVAPGEAAVYMAWQVPAASHEDVPALQVMDWLLANQTAGLLQTRLLLSQKLPDADTYLALNREAGYFMVYGTARDGQSLDEVESLLMGVVDALKRGDFTQADIDAVVLDNEIREMRAQESNEARVYRISQAFITGTPWAEEVRRQEALRAIRREDVMAAATRYLGPGVAVVRRRPGEYQPPKIPKPTITPIPIDPSRSSPFARAVEDMPFAPLEPAWLAKDSDYQQRSMESGTLIAAPNRRNQLFTVTYRIEVGSGSRPLQCFALEVMRQSGTRQDAAQGAKARSPEELRRALYTMGTSIDMRCDPDFVTIEVSGIDRNLEASIGLLREWLRSAEITESIRQAVLANQLSQRKDDMSDTATVSRALGAFALFGERGSPYVRVPSNADLRDASVPMLQARLAELPEYVHDTLYFGPRSADDAAKVLALGKSSRRVPQRWPVQYRPVGGVRILFLHQEVAQSSISIAIPQPALPEADMPLSLLYGGYVGGGMGGLIFQEIREARGLAYRASGWHEPGDRRADQSAVRGILGTQSDKTVEALNTMLELLRSLPVQPERLATARRAIDAEYRGARVDPREVPETVHAWLERGLGEDPRPGYWRSVASIDEATFAAFARRFAQGDVIIGITGDRQRIDMDALRKLGTVEEVAVGQIFGY